MTARGWHPGSWRDMPIRRAASSHASRASRTAARTEAVGGRGIAGQLVAAAFHHAREQGWKVRPLCEYAAGWVRRHPEQADLLR